MTDTTAPKNQPVDILLVEDNDDHAEIIMRHLKKECSVKHLYRACDGQEALDFLFQQGAFRFNDETFVPKLILLDIKLPKRDGFEVLEALKSSEKLKFIPVVMLTTSASENDLVRAYENHANSYLVKPDNFQDFKTLIHDIGVYWFGWNRTG